MKISIITTITNPEENQYPWREAVGNYLSLADEVIIVRGRQEDIKLFKSDNWPQHRMRLIFAPWPEKWHWKELPIHLNAGLAAATGDWIIKMDVDQLFHEVDFPAIRHTLENDAKNCAVVSFVKKTIVNRNHWYRKCALPVAINAAMKNIRFGIAADKKTDWCCPILISSQELKSKVPIGKIVPESMIFFSGIDVWNYDSFFRTKEKQKEIFWRFAQAHSIAFQNDSWGASKEESWQIWNKMMEKRRRGQLMPIALNSHPAAIHQRIKEMSPDEFGYNNWGKSNEHGI